MWEDGGAGVVGGLGVVAAVLVMGIERGHFWWSELFLLGFLSGGVLGGVNSIFSWGCLLTGTNS